MAAAAMMKMISTSRPLSAAKTPNEMSGLRP
jgi:hypothetical protein